MKWIPLFLALVVRSASAGLIAYEGFDYPAKDAPENQLLTVTNRTGGSGWATAWSGVAGLATGSAAYSFPGRVLTTTGNRAQQDYRFQAQAFRRIDAAGTVPAEWRVRDKIGASGTAVWISFLMSDANPAGGFAGLSLCGEDPDQMFIGRRAQGAPVWGVEFSGGDGARSQKPVTKTASLLLVRVDFSPTKTTLNLWVDPTTTDSAELGPPDAKAKSAKPYTFDRVRLGNGGGPSVTWDEIRIGTTAADVLPTRPIPAARGGNSK